MYGYRLAFGVFLSAFASPLIATQVTTGIISTFAGDGTSGNHGDGGQAALAGVNGPSSTALDGLGNLYIADTSNSRVRKVVIATGVITTVAGSFGGYAGDGGPATSARLFSPEGVVVSPSGDLYIADTGNHVIRKVSKTTGIITTVAGVTSLFGGDAGDGGPATSARLNYPSAVAFDAAGNLYIADFSNNRVRKVSVATGIITTAVGSGAFGYSGDGGPATNAALRFPSSIAFDSGGNLYLTDEDNNRVRKVSAATGVITTFAGGGSEYGENFPPAAIALDDPRGVTVDGAGNVYIADSLNERIRKVSAATGLVTTVAGNGDADFLGDGGAATAAALRIPNHVSVDAEGQLYISDTNNSRIRKVTAPTSPAYFMTTLAGNGLNGLLGDGGLASAARLSVPFATAVDAAGNVFIADSSNDRIRRVDAATGIITTFAGTFEGDSGDNGPATAAELSSPRGIALDAAGNLYIADYFNDRVRKVTVATNIITTVAGNGQDGAAGDGGAATAAQLNGPTGVAVDSAGNLYIADANNHRIRKVTATTGIMTTVAGNGTLGFSGDGAAATAAQLRYPGAVAVDGSGNVYIADRENNRVRKVTVATGIITTVAGGGGTYDEPQLATQARLDDPAGIALDAMNNLYIADDAGAHRIKKVSATTNFLTTVVGNGVIGFEGDGGVGTAASMRYPLGVTVDTQGALYIADSDNQRVRVAYLSIPDVPPTFSATAMSTSLVQISWSAVGSASYYEIWRSSNHGAFALVGTPGGTSATDSGRASNTTYLYKIRARRGTAASPFSSTELATTIVFQDATLTATIQTVHVSQLRTAVNAVRAAAGLLAATFPDATLVSGSTAIKLAHLTSLRTALDEARAAIGAPAISYAQPTLTAGSIVRATHLTELRAGTQ